MGDTSSRPAAAPAGAPTVGGTSLEAALAEIEGERARAANMHPPGVSGPPEIELREVESDEAMARRLQSEEDARGNAAPPAATPAYYPKMPYAVPQPFAPVTHTAPTVGRGLISDVNSRNGVARPARRGGPFPLPPQPSEVARPVPYGFQREFPTGFSTPYQAPPEDDAALARRLQAEEDAKRDWDPRENAADSGTSRDALLARRLQEEEDAAAASSSSPSSSIGFGTRPPSSRNASLCPGCASPIAPFASHVRTAFGKWHRACFACAGCGGAIADGSHAMKDGRPFHVACYRDRFHPRCSVCREKIPFEGQAAYAEGGGSNGGVVRWISHPYWCDATYCPAHERDGTKKCDGCERMETSDAAATGSAFAELPDGRSLCLECASTAVVDTDRDSKPVYDDVCRFMAELGLPLVKGGAAGLERLESGARADADDNEDAFATTNDLLWRHRPPLHLVSQDALDAANGKEAWHVGRTARTRGLCLFTEHVIRAVERVPRWDPGFAGGFLPVGFTERAVGAPRFGTATVNAVVVLYGLPFVAFGAVLAHECTHAYIRIAGGFPRLTPKTEEGLCQLVALLWVEDVAARGAPSGVSGGGAAKARSDGVSSVSSARDGWEERNLAAMAGYVANQIRTDPSETYGNGLRVALGAYRRVGLRAVFEHVRATGEIPTT